MMMARGDQQAWYLSRWCHASVPFVMMSRALKSVSNRYDLTEYSVPPYQTTTNAPICFGFTLVIQ